MAVTSPARADLADFRTLAGRIDMHGPRYTSYPTADRFHDRFGVVEYEEALALCRAKGEADGDTPLSLYLHVPFCANICYYCGCNKFITRDHGRSARYVRYLAREMAMVAAQLGDTRRRVVQSHWGGGTPTFLDSAEMRAVMDALHRHFLLDPDGEHAIEIDPRCVDAARIAELATLGFNRISLGVQDFDPEVQRAIHRVQSFAETREVVDAARRHGFRSVSLDLIYGLPHQTTARFAATIDQVLALRPDRLSVYSYAHLPQLFKPQRRIDEAALPPAGEKLDILVSTIERLADAGYVYIGMDHFALPDDALAQSQQNGRLQRNFQGYATHAGYDQLGFGVSAIGDVAGSYVQNARTLEGYYAALDAATLPVLRGTRTSVDDRLRKEIIGELMCNGALDMAMFGARHAIDFPAVFAGELIALAPLEQEGLVRRDRHSLQVTPLGRLLVRRIAMVFDRYLQNDATRLAPGTAAPLQAANEEYQPRPSVTPLRRYSRVV